jgi:hypothetical protein
MSEGSRAIGDLARCVRTAAPDGGGRLQRNVQAGVQPLEANAPGDAAHGPGASFRGGGTTRPWVEGRAGHIGRHEVVAVVSVNARQSGRGLPARSPILARPTRRQVPPTQS